MSCAFCRVIEQAGDTDVLVVDEPQVVAFLDINPLFPGHLLVVPRQHILTLDVLPDDVLLPLFALTRRAVRVVADVMGAEGAFVANNNVVSQSVPHLHVHVVPRTKGDGLRGFFWPRTSYADEDHRRDVRRRLRAGFAA